MATLLNLIALLSPFVLVIGIGMKFFKISRMPLNIRWEIYPLPSAKRERCQGSYMEEVDWIKKKHEKGLFGEFIEPFKEIFFLHRVKKFNLYGIWTWSIALHWGVWLLFLWNILILIAFVSNSMNLSKIIFLPYLSCFLGIVGTVGLILKRINNKELKLYTSGIEYFNLIFLFVIFISGLLMIYRENSTLEALLYVESVLSFNLSISEFHPFTLIHFLLFEIFLIYIPFSKFFHGPVKFFTFHKILWDDYYQKKDSPEEKKILQQLNYKVNWAGPHILPEQTWLENARNTNLHEKWED